MDLNLLDFVQQDCIHGVPRLVKIERQFGLAINHHRTRRKPLEIDAKSAIRGREVDTFVHQPFAIHAFADPRLAQQVDSPCFQHAGPDARQHVVTTLALQQQGFDPLPVQ